MTASSPLVLGATLLGGIGLFLLGMTMLTDGLKVAAGRALERILARSTRTRWRGLLSGILITALVQSSSAVTVAAKAGTATACFLCTGTVRTLVAGCGPASCASGVADTAADANGGDVAIHTMAGARPAGAWKAAPGIACKGLRAAPHHHDSASACSSKDKPTAAPHRRVLASGLMVPRHPLHPVPTPAGRPAGTAGIRKWRPGFQSAPP